MITMACISTDRMRDYESCDGVSITSMPTISTERGAADRATVSETVECWFDSNRSEISGSKFNWMNSLVLRGMLRVRITAGRFYPLRSVMVNTTACGAVNLRSNRSQRTNYNAVAKTVRRGSAKSITRGFNSRPRFQFTCLRGATGSAQRTLTPMVECSNHSGGTIWPL